MAIATARGRAHGDEDRVRALDPRSEVGGEGQPVGRSVVGDELIKAGFIDRHAAGQDRIDLASVLIDAHDVMAEIGETGARYQADISRADHRDLHKLPAASFEKMKD